jgi:hypothetical protein
MKFDKRYLKPNKKRKEINKFQLYQDMWSKYLLKGNNPSKWWGIPQKDSKNTGRYKEKILFLVNPSSIPIMGPSIIEGKNAYHPKDLTSLFQKSIYWKWGLKGKILKKTKGLCINCKLMLTEPYMYEIHHILPIKFGGTNHIKNLTPICRECHREVSTSIKKNDIDKISYFISNKILSPDVITVLNI